LGRGNLLANELVDIGVMEVDICGTPIKVGIIVPDDVVALVIKAREPAQLPGNVIGAEVEMMAEMS